MMPLFANPAGLWLLLGIPAILAIHFLQQRARVARTSTWFLIEKLAPDSARGRTWDRLRSSRTLWLQLLSVLLAAWVVAEPRWLRAESAQTVAIVLDASASMDAFRAPAVAAAEREMTLAEPFAARTTWIIMTTDPRQPALYRGLDRAAAAAALARWQPSLGAHDFGPALRLARGLAGATGQTLLVTDRRERVPADQRAAGVGRPLENVGFAGAAVTRGDDGAHVWRALVKNHSPTSQRRTWRLVSGATQSAEQTIDLAPQAVSEISARLPDGTPAVTVVLSPDDYTMDDRLPIVRPEPKPLAVAVEGTDEAADFFRRLAAGIEGVVVTSGGSAAPFRIRRLGQDELAKERRAGIFWPPGDVRAQAQLMTDPVAPARDPLVEGLNWQGWFGTGPHGFVAAPADTVLLWQSRWPLVFVRTMQPAPGAGSGADATVTAPRQLIFAFDWETTNASRLPATVLLARRFIETTRDAQRAPYAGNFDAAAVVALAGLPGEVTPTLTYEPVAGGPSETIALPAIGRGPVRAPSRPGFFTITNGSEVLVRGAAQFADPRQGDFRAAEKFFNDVRADRQAALERNTTGDPFAVVWLAVLAALVAWSWWTRVSKAGAAAGGGTDAGAAGTDGIPVARAAEVRT